MHTNLHRKKLLARVRRIQGQAAAVENMLRNQPDEFSRILTTIAACRGALTSLMLEVLDGHVHHHILDPERKSTRAQRIAADQLMGVLKSYLH